MQLAGAALAVPLRAVPPVGRQQGGMPAGGGAHCCLPLPARHPAAGQGVQLGPFCLRRVFLPVLNCSERLCRHLPCAGGAGKVSRPSTLGSFPSLAGWVRCPACTSHCSLAETAECAFDFNGSCWQICAGTGLPCGCRACGQPRAQRFAPLGDLHSLLGGLHRWVL